MILVFLLLGLIIISSFITCIMLVSSVKIKIRKLHIYYYKNKFKIKFISSIEIYLFNRVKIFEKTIDNDKIKYLMQSGKLDILKFKNNITINSDVLKLLKNLEFKLERFNFIGDLGTENAAFTAIIISLIYTFFSIIIAKNIEEYNKEKYFYKVNGLYSNQNIVNLQFNCIISIKIVNIINTLYIYLKKGRVKKNERTPNRRSYAYSHE